MFSSKEKLKADLKRAKTSSAPKLPIVRSKSKYAEQRRAGRKGIWCVCVISSDASQLREAIILDVSKTGARVRFRSRGNLPAEIRIKASRIGLNRRAKVVWQTGFDAGLEFIPDASLMRAKDD